MFVLDYKWPATGSVPPTKLPSGCKLIIDITATDDTDNTISIPHLMQRAPLEVYFTGILGPLFTGLSNWTAALIDDTQIIVRKSSAENSGQPVPQVRMIVGLPHSLEL